MQPPTTLKQVQVFLWISWILQESYKRFCQNSKATNDAHLPIDKI